MNRINKKNDFRQGYRVKRITTDNQLHKKFKDKTNIKNTAMYFPNGLVSFILILLFYLIFLITVLTMMLTSKDIIQRLQWHVAVLSLGMAYFLINLLWWIGRTGLFNATQYASVKLGRVIHLEKVREKIKYLHEPAVNDVTNYREYNDYCAERKTFTKKWFLISLGSSSAVAIISLIIYFCV